MIDKKKACKRAQGGREHPMSRKFKAACGKSYAVEWAMVRHNKQEHND